MPNEQTSVPLYAASEVLTAANMNISAGTGVPVFATTVTRDAAFGGASEKVLAEGQLCYLSATNVVQYYDGAAWATVGPAVAAASGLVCVKAETAFTTSASVTTDGVFTSTYSNYLIWFNYTNTNTTDILMRLRASAVAATSNYNRQLVTFNQTTTSPSQGNAAVSLIIQPSNGNFKSSATINLANPQLAQPTNITYSVTVNAGNYTTGQSLHLWATNQTDSTQFDGIEWAVSSGSMTGTYAIYGYSKTV